MSYLVFCAIIDLPNQLKIKHGAKRRKGANNHDIKRTIKV